jgi:hypothetical protein
MGPRRTDIHVLTALSRHPCRSAHSASSAFGLHPSRDWRCLGFLCMKIKSRSEADQARRTCGSELAHEEIGTFTGFLVFEIQHSRASSLPQGGGMISKIVGVWTCFFPAKAGPTNGSACIPWESRQTSAVGPALAGKLLICAALLIFIRKKLSHHQSRLGCRLSAGLAPWAEPHGCGESAVRTWMSVRRGPTE